MTKRTSTIRSIWSLLSPAPLAVGYEVVDLNNNQLNIMLINVNYTNTKTHREDYRNPQYVQWKNQLRKRSKNLCESKPCINWGCQAHHIRKWSVDKILRYDPANGIWLCDACHKRCKGKETEYEERFDYFVQNPITRPEYHARIAKQKERDDYLNNKYLAGNFS